MKQIVRRVKIIGTGSYVPENVVTNKQLEQKVDTSDIWVQTNLGIRERRIASETESTSDLAANAAMQAMNDAGLNPNEIDLIIVATATPD